MMKRIMACLIAIACLLTAVSALADGDMKVIKVKQAVNMRQQTNTDSAVVAQVPLGTVLSDCKKVEGTDWYAVNYQGISGYIRYDFLEPVASAETAPVPAAEPAAEPAPVPADEPAPAADDADRPVQSITDASAYIDDYVILDTTIGDVRVIARQIFKEDCEYLMVAGFDAAGSQLWMQETMTGDITELMQTDCFIAGTADAPLVMVYNAWSGLMAYDPATGENVWNVLKEDVELGASVSYAVAGDGTIYIGGYYGPDPVAIDVNGNVLWQSDSGEAQANWLYEIQLADQGVGGHYSMLSGDKSGWVAYNYDGTVNRVIYD